MSTICAKAKLSNARAFYVLGQLVIQAQGTKPTRCHQVRVERAPIRIYPPQYQIVACIDEGVICPQQVMPYDKLGIFIVSKETLEAMRGVAVLHHRDGAEQVKITVIELSKKQVSSGTGEGAREGGMPFPFSLSKLLETGRATDLEILSSAKLHTATGYSNSFSFTEAFQDAIDNLPPDQNEYPDKLVNVVVVRTGAEFGGIVGLNRMYVTVASFY